LSIQPGIADDVKTLSIQLDTVISEGSGAIPGVKRQRLALSRALLSQSALPMSDNFIAYCQGFARSSEDWPPLPLKDPPELAW